MGQLLVQKQHHRLRHHPLLESLAHRPGLLHCPLLGLLARRPIVTPVLLLLPPYLHPLSSNTLALLLKSQLLSILQAGYPHLHPQTNVLAPLRARMSRSAHPLFPNRPPRPQFLSEWQKPAITFTLNPLHQQPTVWLRVGCPLPHLFLVTPVLECKANLHILRPPLAQAIQVFRMPLPPRANQLCWGIGLHLVAKQVVAVRSPRHRELLSLCPKATAALLTKPLLRQVEAIFFSDQREPSLNVLGPMGTVFCLMANTGLLDHQSQLPASP